MKKRIGILGGMSPESTIHYYQKIIRSYVERYGDHNYPEIVIYSVSFQPFIDYPKNGEWDKVAEELVVACHHLEAAGVDFIVIATNTMHFVLDKIVARVSVPIISIIDVVCSAVINDGFKKVGLLGTKFTMETNLYSKHFSENDIDVIVPNSFDREFVNHVIYNELVNGVVTEESRKGFVAIVEKMKSQGAEGVILGCTEIPMLISEQDVSIRLFDTTNLHAEEALQLSLR